ncbi:MAG: Diaminohydroxyphosphoribosylaminopyrimidine deaminase [Bacteroidota bacterium]|jgi:diaminohydroxyphosphoribosylaminopyrimidine deaminase/5-amino-6-(5-phosphoribosylamino)uracil reductase
MLTDEIWMQRALDLAQLGGGFVVPNPWVGCVIVRDEIILGEGYHAQYGGPHAEVQAFAGILDACGATAYVSLEPCSHTGKTPPCADLLIKHQVQRVVICNLDPNPLVAGQGVAKLQAAGIDVQIGVLSEKGEQINRRFFYYHRNKRPYITVKYATSSDQFIAQANGDAHVFSNPISHQLVHRLRAEHQAILIGVNTANADNPSLTTRSWPGNSPLRLVLDPQARMLENLILLADDFPTIIFTHTVSQTKGNKAWVALGSTNYLVNFMAYCQEKSIQSILIEGGAKTIEAFMQEIVVQEIIHIESREALDSGISAPHIDEIDAKKYSVGANNNWIIQLGKENLA